MNKLAYTALGLIMGVTLAVGAVSYANTQKMITLYKDKNHTLYIYGNETKLPPGQEILNYNNRVYVPLRFLSENMDLKVDYQEGSKDIYVSKKIEKPKEKPKAKEEPKTKKEPDKVEIKQIDKDTEINPEDVKKIDEKDFEKLPIRYTDKDKNITIELKNIYRKLDLSGKSEFSFEIKNKGQDGFNIVYQSAKFMWDDNREVTTPSGYRKEDRHKDLYSTLTSNYEGDVYFNLEPIPEDVKYGVLKFDIEWPRTNKIEHVAFPVKLD